MNDDDDDDVATKENIASLARSISCHAPMPMKNPSTLLTLLTAILCSPTPPTLGELSSIFLPLAALKVRALANAAPQIVLAAQIPHDHAGPVLHVLSVVSHCELLYQREDVEIVW